jgi:Ca2+-transporting ATPase
MTARITRGDKVVTVDSQELVVGDIIDIPTGDAIPADCVVISSNDLSVSEANLTGEPEPIRKEGVSSSNYEDNPNPFLMQTTLVETGTCKAIVVAVGMNTFVGRTGLTMNIEKDLTPLQKKLETIAE